MIRRLSVSVAACALLFTTELRAAPYVCLETSEGDICFNLLSEVAPNTVANFLRYVEDGAYTNSLIHGSIQPYLIQGGGYWIGDDDFISPIPTHPPIASEFSRSNLLGTVAMVLMDETPDSAASQWFINTDNNAFIDEAQFTVFAEVIKGMDVVEKIARMRIEDMRDLLGAPFGLMPLDLPVGTDSVAREHLIIVKRVYALEQHPLLKPYQCSLESPGDTLTEFCGSTATFPVLVSDVLYEGTLQYIPGRDGLVFAVDRSRLKVLADTGQVRATFADGVLTIPSLRNGTRTFSDLRLNLTRSDPLEFTLDSFTPR